MILSIMYYFINFGDLCDSTSFHLYGFPGSTTHYDKKFILLLLTSFISEIKFLFLFSLSYAMSSFCLSTRPSGNPTVKLSVRKFVCQSVRQEVRLSICPSGSPFVDLSVGKSVCQSVRQEVRLSICPSGSPSVNLSVCRSVRREVRLSFCPSGSPSVDLSVWKSVCRSVRCILMELTSFIAAKFVCTVVTGQRSPSPIVVDLNFRVEGA